MFEYTPSAQDSPSLAENENPNLETAPSGKAYRSLEIYISFLERLTPQCGWIQVNEPILCTDMADRHWVFRPEMREKHNYRGVPDGIQ